MATASADPASRPLELLWYLPNELEPGHRGDLTADGWGTLDFTVDLARTAEAHGWSGALLGTGWGRPDTFTVATAVAALTTTFRPLVAIRPGYWQPAQFASAAATLQHLSRGRLLVNVVSGQDDLAAYGDAEGDQAQRYARTKEFMRLVRRLWTEEHVTFDGAHFRVAGSTVVPRLPGGAPRLYFGGASPAAERVAATEADVQLFWGEPLDGIEARISRLRALSTALDRDLPPLEFGLRVTTVVRDTTDQAWRDAEAKVAALARRPGEQLTPAFRRESAVGQRRLADLAERGDVLDENLYTVPGRYGAGGAGATWLVGSADDVAAALRRYADLGVTHFVLSDTPYRQEAARVGDALVPRLRGTRGAAAR